MSCFQSLTRSAFLLFTSFQHSYKIFMTLVRSSSDFHLTKYVIEVFFGMFAIENDVCVSFVVRLQNHLNKLHYIMVHAKKAFATYFNHITFFEICWNLY